MRLVALIALAAGIAHADPNAADVAADAATALAKQGQFGAAALKFREAYRADPRPDLMCNVGVAYYKAKDLPRAERYLEQCVQSGASVDRGFITAVKQALASLETSLRAGEFTPVSFSIEPNQATITAVGGEPFDEPILGSRVVWFPSGAYTVVIHAEGYADQRLEIAASGHDAIAKSITLERAPVVVVAPPVEGRRTHGLEQEVVVDGPRKHPQPSLVRPVTATIIAGVAAASAVAFYGFARIRANDANDASTAGNKPAYDDAAHAARTWQVVAISSAVLAAASAGAAAYFWTHRVSVEPAPQGATLSLAGRF